MILGSKIEVSNFRTAWESGKLDNSWRKHSVNPSSAAGHGRGWSGNCFSDDWLGGWGLSEAPGQAR